ncbi:tRNA (adenine(58)-N(1))-methyltransferase non-catalytic subunit TRM6 [Biomphalaria pfeifferi]|uniref:tRNA (adenine(58)-N(1))-methyltransferase non-catalytic subunit TRM6 n=1 Tax=Biomphalaria pfeifferi TaxID=112525 RepID=A0AAD8F4M1_BIOPF|nr:tRNA (adenine(58)-N(1))-methyltransferase non-catalytic subunit TRM6 [Biomphalaria pfeifferi]
MANNIIADGDHVIFKRDGTCRVFQIKPDRQAYFEKVKFTVNDLLGQQFGSTFKVDRGNLVKLAETKVLELEQVASEPVVDNRNLLDSESNQKMRLEDIQKMKSDGLSGEKIIEELVENSETFDSKTNFSQAKYLKKKKKKHLQMFTALRPTARLVIEIFSKEPAKICFLRLDTVSKILNFSNVMYGSNVAVVSWRDLEVMYIEPLVECYTWIKEQQVGCQLKFSETWCRDYQVLPNQTHPVINMNGTGGYLLTYTTVSKLS